MKKSLSFGLFLIFASSLQASQNSLGNNGASSFHVVKRQLAKMRSVGESHSCENIIPFSIKPLEKTKSLFVISLSPRTVSAGTPSPTIDEDRA